MQSKYSRPGRLVGHLFALLKVVRKASYVFQKHAYNLTDNLDHDLELLELEETKGPAASATAPQATHGSYQTILEVLGARLADDGLQEASCSMQDEGMTITSADDQVMSNGT